MEKILDYLMSEDALDGWNELDLCALRKFGRSNGYKVQSGATRVCIYREEWNYVLKMDIRLQGSYCAMEAYNYSRAVEYNVQRVLLPITKVTTLDNGIKVYRQQKFSTEWEFDKFTGKERKKLNEAYAKVAKGRAYAHIRNSNLGDIKREWLTRVTQLYGKKFMLSLQEWADECDVNDLHRGNIGMLKGRPIILDYAGYHGSSYTPAEEIALNF